MERTRFIITQRYKILSSVAKLLTILIAVLVLVGAVGFYRLPPSWLVPSFKEALAETIGNVQLAIPQAEMRWGGWRHPLGIQVRQVTLRGEDSGLTLEMPRLLLSLKILPLFKGKAEIGRFFFESAKVYSKNCLIGTVSAKAKVRGKTTSLQADFHHVNITALIHLALRQRIPEAVFSIEGKLLLEGSSTAGVTKINLHCKSAGGTLIIPQIYPEPLNLEKAHLSLTGTGQTLSLKKFYVKRGGAQLTVQGLLRSPDFWKRIYEQGGKLELSLEGRGSAIPVDDLKLLWPHGLSPKPRHWVVHQLSNGQADQVTTQMRSVIHVDTKAKIKEFEVPRIRGRIDASDITVDYFGNLPPVKGVTGQCTFTREHFKVDAVGVAQGIHLKTANIVIHDTHLKDQHIDIALDLEGPVRNSLEVINSAPLYLAKRLDLDPTHISGQAVTQVHLAFPLETNVPLACVKVTAKSQIKDGMILYDSQRGGKPLMLDRGTFNLDVSKKSLKMIGEGYLQDVATQIQWQEYFEDKDVPFRRQFILEGLLDLQKLKNFGINAASYLDGQALTHIQYTVNQDSAGVIEGFADLTPSIMVSPVLPWQKERGKPGHLKIQLRKKPQQDGYVLDNASLVAPGLMIIVAGKGDYGEDHFEIEQLQLADSSLKSTIQRDKAGIFQATVRGKVLDLSHILDDSAPELLLRPKPWEDTQDDTQINVNLILDEVRLGKNSAIHQVKGEMLYRQNTLMKASLKGKAPHNDAAISLSMVPLSKDRQQFTLESGDGGHLLETLGADYDLEGGNLVIKGVKVEKYPESKKGTTKGGNKSWEISGNITLDDFTINKAPLLARLLSAASLQGIVNFFSGRGIHFHEGSADFSLSPESLSLKNVRLISPSLGLLLAGSLDRIKHKVDFSGEIIPLFFVNTVLAQILPWISGGRDEGIFMTQFTLTGERHDPALAINPITTVTPGLFRELLRTQEAKR